VELPCLGEMSYASLCSTGAGLVLAILWVSMLFGGVPLAGLWWLILILASCISILVIALVRINSLKIAAALLLIFFVYDVCWVFLTAFIITKQQESSGSPPPDEQEPSVMESVARSLIGMPAMYIVPGITGFRLLGLGDVALPGLFLCFLYRVDVFLRTDDGARVQRSMSVHADDSTPERVVGCRTSQAFWLRIHPRSWGYFNIAFVGYELGLVATFVSLVAMNTAQPALLFLVPFTLVPTCLVAWKRDELSLLWHGPRAAMTRVFGDEELGHSGSEDENATPLDVTDGERTVKAPLLGDAA
jgi:signal peptide peptidase-like 3